MVGLMDCNNFFVSCERLFRPDLKTRPVAVLSSNDGCIIARSQEVKDLGIPMGIPLFQVRDVVKKHDVVLFSSNFSLYRDISRRVMHVLTEEQGDISVYSVDEAFFDIPLATSTATVHEIRARIMQKTGIPVSFGIAPTKTIAKIANSAAKKQDGVVWLSAEEAQTWYPTIPCGTVWGIGREMTKKLETFGIRTVDMFLARGLSFARDVFGVSGERLFLELSGIQAEGGHHEFSEHASIMSTRSFSKGTNDRGILMSAIGYHVAYIAEKLRERHLFTRTLTIVAAPSRHGAYALRQGSASISFEMATADTSALLRYACTLLDDLYDPEVEYKKAGAIVSDLVPVAFASPSLFSGAEAAKPTEVDSVVDSLNHRFGSGTIRSGVILNTDAWSSNARLRSRGYTTQWSEIASVKAI
jgi:DNA polymerase V